MIYKQKTTGIYRTQKTEFSHTTIVKLQQLVVRINCAARNEELTAWMANNQTFAGSPKQIHGSLDSRGGHLELGVSFTATVRVGG